MNKYKLLTATALFAVGAFGLAACDKQAAMDDTPAMTAENLKGHVAYLADDRMKGRDVGTPEHREASEYIANFYKDLGLKPMGENGTYFQEVPFFSLQSNQDSSWLSYTAGGETKTFTSDEWVSVGNAKMDEMAANGDLVFVGYGIHAPEQGHDDYAGVDVTGKIILRIAGTPAGTTGLQEFKAEQGAAGVIGLLKPSENSAAMFKNYHGFFAGARLNMMKKGDEKPAGDEHATAFISAEAATGLFAAAGMDYADAVKMADTKGFTAKAMGISGDMKQVTASSMITSPNVAAVLEGSDPDLKDEYVIISAHSDHVGMCAHVEGRDTAAADDTICNGALDNASGTATTMEVAKALSQLETAPRRSVMFLNVTAEEKGLLGSQYFAEYPTVPADKITANVNIDMPILFYDFADVVAFGAEHSSIWDIAETALSEINVGLAEDPMPEQRLFTRSDHYNFVKKGVPSVFLMTGPTSVNDDPATPVKEREGYKEFYKFLNTNYHSAADDMAQPIMWDVHAKYTLANYKIIEALANADVEARWNEGNEYGDKYAPGKPRAAAPAAD